MYPTAGELILYTVRTSIGLLTSTNMDFSIVCVSSVMLLLILYVMIAVPTEDPVMNPFTTLATSGVSDSHESI